MDRVNRVTLGTDPVGVEWNVYPRSGESTEAFERRVALGRERLAMVRARAERTVAVVATTPVVEAAPAESEPVTIEAARRRYASARAIVMRLKGETARLCNRRKRGEASRFAPGYEAAAERLLAARKMLRKLERQAAKGTK